MREFYYQSVNLILQVLWERACPRLGVSIAGKPAPTTIP